MSAEKQKVNFDYDIAILPLVQWLDYAAGCDESVFVALPLIQRGSVWKPEQLINLWDTLLRGMPLGSLIYSKIPKDTIVREIGENKSFPAPEGAIGLIDGQQRTLAMLIAWLKVGEKMDWTGGFGLILPTSPVMNICLDCMSPQKTSRLVFKKPRLIQNCLLMSGEKHGKRLKKNMVRKVRYSNHCKIFCSQMPSLITVNHHLI